MADFSPALGTGPTVTAGDGTFHITLDSFSNPGRGQNEAGGLTARVTASVPEPESILLLALGGLGMLTLIRRKRAASDNASHVFHDERRSSLTVLGPTPKARRLAVLHQLRDHVRFYGASDLGKDFTGRRL